MWVYVIFIKPRMENACKSSTWLMLKVAGTMRSEVTIIFIADMQQAWLHWFGVRDYHYISMYIHEACYE